MGAGVASPFQVTASVFCACNMLLLLAKSNQCPRVFLCKFATIKPSHMLKPITRWIQRQKKIKPKDDVNEYSREEQLYICRGSMSRQTALRHRPCGKHEVFMYSGSSCHISQSKVPPIASNI